MSGIVGIVHDDQMPIDQTLLKQMTAAMGFRGPDAQAIWANETVGFGHTLLQTTYDTDKDEQPFSLDGQVWIVADARIDDRSELIAKLNHRERLVTPYTSDIALILHAYLTWHHGCLEHLIGDFAFALWDERTRSLFCACDQFGVVPFYYAKVQHGLIFGNTLNSLRLHPGVSHRINDQAIGDYLLFRMNQNASTTIFTDVHSLPPAHSLHVQSGHAKTHRYYSAPAPENEVRPDKDGCVDQFRQLLHQAVADRLRTTQVATYLSGGMDSTSIAATAHQVLSETSPAFDLQAYTMTFKQRIRYHEAFYAKQVAQQLGIRHHPIVADSFAWDIDIDQQDFCPPEPSLIRASEFRFTALKSVANNGRILLTGEGGDPQLQPVGPYWQQLVRTGRWRQLWHDALYYFQVHRRLPMGLKSVLGAYRKKRRQHLPALPSWLNPDFAKRYGLQDRFTQIKRGVGDQYDHQRGMLTDVLWRRLFTWHDPGFTGVPTKVRHPFFDLRLLHFMLKLPAPIWTSNKFLLRVAMSDRLPHAVLERSKTLRGTHPFYVAMRQQGVPGWCVKLSDWPALAPYVNAERLKKVLLSPEDYLPRDYKMILRPLSLSYWFYKQEWMMKRTNHHINSIKNQVIHHHQWHQNRLMIASMRINTDHQIMCRQRP